jgi:hypothetical protein
VSACVSGGEKRTAGLRRGGQLFSQFIPSRRCGGTAVGTRPLAAGALLGSPLPLLRCRCLWSPKLTNTEKPAPDGLGVPRAWGPVVGSAEIFADTAYTRQTETCLCWHTLLGRNRFAGFSGS